MRFLRLLGVTNTVFIILNSREGLKEHLEEVLFGDHGRWSFFKLLVTRFYICLVVV